MSVPGRLPYRGSPAADSPPPVLPPRPGTRAIRPVPVAPPPIQDEGSDDEDYLQPDEANDRPEEIYDDCNEGDEEAPDEIYDDCDDGPDDAGPEEIYDDCDDGPDNSQDAGPEEIYDDCDDGPDNLQDEGPEDFYDDCSEPSQPQVSRKLPARLPEPPQPKRPDRTRKLPPPPPDTLSPDQPNNTRREPSPPRNPPPGRKWNTNDPPSVRPVSPGRQVKPSTHGQRGLPPIPTPKDKNEQSNDRFRQGSLPPIPPLGGSPGRSRSPIPVPRNRPPASEIDDSPVVVPLKTRHRGNAPPPPLPQDPDDDGVSDEEGEENFDDMQDEEKTDSESDDFPPPPSPISHKKLMISSHAVSAPPPPPPPPPPIPSAIHPSSDLHGNGAFGADDERGPSSPPAPPPPPPPLPFTNQGPVVTRLPPQPKPTPNPPQPKPASGPGGVSIDISQLKELRAGLRKVSVDTKSHNSSSSSTNSNSESPRETTHKVSDSRKMFENNKPAQLVRSNSRPEIAATHPPVNRSYSIGGSPSFTTPNGNNNKTNSSNEPEGPPLPPRPANMVLSSHACATSSSSENSSSSGNSVRGSPAVSHSVAKSGPFSSVVTVGSPNVNPIPPISVILYNHHGKHTNVPSFQPTPAARVVPKYEPPKEEEILDTDDIYDDASSGDILDRFDWYHGLLNRKQADARVKSVGKDGTYLVRVSEKDPKYPYTLVVLHNGHVNNLRVRKRDDNKVALGDEKTDEVTFADVTALISHHKDQPVVLLGSTQSQVKLQHTPPKY